MTEQEKSDYLDSLDEKESLDQADFLILKDLSSDPDPYIRSCIPLFLMDFLTEDALAVLIDLAKDKDPLVRTEAYDSLSAFGDQAAADFIRGAILRERNALARAYAITSWAEVTILISGVTAAVSDFAVNRQAGETSRICLLNWNYALYLFGDGARLADLLGGLQETDYHLRRQTLAILSDILDRTNSQAIRTSLLALLQHETVPTVRDEAVRLLKLTQSV